MRSNKMRVKSMWANPVLGIMAGGLTGVLAASPPARAGYAYHVAAAPATQTFGGTTVTMTGNSFSGLDGTNSVSLADVSVVSDTLPPGADAIDEPYTLQVTLSDPAVPGALATFDITGQLTGTVAADHASLDSTYLSVTPASRTVGQGTYKVDVGPLNISNVYYSPPDVNSPDGDGGRLGGQIVASLTPAPEPTGLGLLGVAAAGLLIRRRRTLARAESETASTVAKGGLP